MAIEKKDIKTISLNELERLDNLSVWVVNNSNPPGTINMSVNDGTGEAVSVVIPLTWVPVDLTTQVTKKAIITNPQFRRLVTSSMLLLVDESEATRVLKDGDASKESKRIYTMQNVGEINMPQEVKNQVVAAEAKVSGFVMNLVARTDVDEDSCLSALRSQAHSLSGEDLSYLVDNSPYQNVKSWASEQLTDAA